jgi:hypothetical protein
MARWDRSSSRLLAQVLLAGFVLACSTISAGIAATPTDSVTGLSLDLCSQGKNRSNAFDSRSGLSSSGWQWAQYQCAPSCTAQTLDGCSHDFIDDGMQKITYTRGGKLRIMQSVEFVVDQMAGSIVFSPDGDPATTVVFHGGVGGTASRGSQLSTYLLANTNAKVVWISWLSGAPGVFGTDAAGWFTRKNAIKVTIKTQSLRPATVIRWIHDNIAGGTAIGTAACSMGTVATLSPGVWWQSDSYFRYQQFIGGPANWDVNASCGKSGPIANGRCDTAPLHACNSSSPCSGSDDTCNRPSDLMADEFYKLMDYLADIPITVPPNQLACHGGDPTPYTLYNDSSFNPLLNPGTFALTHPVDFLTDEMTTSQTGSYCPANSHEDHCMGLGSEENVFHEIFAGSPAIAMHWNDNPTGEHCQSWVDGTGLSGLLAGMGL